MLDFIFLNINLYSAQAVNGLYQTLKANADIIGNIHVQVHVQHIYRLFRPASRIGSIAFAVFIITQIHIRITVYGTKLHFSRILIDRSDHYCIGTVSFIQIIISGINTEQSDITVSLHSCIILYCIVDYNVLFVNIDFLNGGLFQHRPENNCQHNKSDHFHRKHYNSSCLSGLSLFGHVLFPFGTTIFYAGIPSIVITATGTAGYVILVTGTASAGFIILVTITASAGLSVFITSA